MTKMVIQNEIWGYFDELPRSARLAIYEKLKKRPKGFHQTSAYQLGRWDGYMSHFDTKYNTFYLYQLDEILDELNNWIDLEQIEVHDLRKTYSFSFPYINEDFIEESGYSLYYYQIDAIEKALEEKKGVLELCTSSGKTLIAGGIIKATEHHFPSITIVPSNKLVTQTYEMYNSLDIQSVGKIDQKVKKDEDRQKVINNNRHIVVTWQTLKNIKEYFEGFEGVVLHDEVHNFSNVAIDLWENIFYNAQFRLGLTGTLPEDDPWKRETIFCRLGNGVIKQISDFELRSQGYISDAEIEMIPVIHEKAEEEAKDLSKEYEWTYDTEFKYLSMNQSRMKAIGDFVRMLPAKNTLILGHANFIEGLANYLNLDYVTKDTTYDKREELFENFRNRNDYILPASYGTSSTGISVNEIYRLILVDPGKSNVLVSQSIGRGLRLDGKYNQVEILDIYSNMIYSLKHKKERKKLYSDKNITYYESNQKIVV